MNIQYFHISWLNIFQAYEKEDEAPAAVPAEKKEKAATTQVIKTGNVVPLFVEV